MKLTDKEKIEEINSITRAIAYKVFHMKEGKYKFIQAYDKLSARVYLDHDISLSKATGGVKRRGESMFDHLHSEELDKVLQSAKNLIKMYNEVVERKSA